MRRAFFLLALLAGPIVPSPARADTNWSVGVTADARLMWIDDPPSLSHINGTSVLPLTDPTGGLWAIALHGDVFARRGPLLFPLVGLTLGVGDGGYGGSADPQAYRRDGPVRLVSLSLPGVGVGTAAETWRWRVSIDPAIDYLTTVGHFVVQGVDVDSSGDGLAFALRSRAELCLRGDESSTWICALGGPTLLQGDRWLDGGYVGIGTMFE